MKENGTQVTVGNSESMEDDVGGRVTSMELDAGEVIEISEKNDFKVSMAGVAGNILEWYDFAVFGYFSDIIGDNFFPKEEEGSNNALVKSFIVFGAAFLARPLGGAIIGLMGDTVGRKSALETSVFLMAFPTFALGCLPTYDSFGGLATFFLIMLRLLQGVSVGGQLMSSVVFTLERTDVSRWGVWGSSVNAFSAVGVFIGSLFSYILREALTDEELHDWGWRIPFFFSIFGLIPACYLKRHAKELPQQTQATNNSDGNSPLMNALKKDNLWTIICAILVVSVAASSYYVISIWLPMYMETIRDPPIPHAFAISTVCGLVTVPLTFLGGWFADQVSPSTWRYVLIVSSAMLGILCPIIFSEISSNKENIGAVTLFCILLLIFSMIVFNGSMTPFLVSLFPAEVRLTSLSISYNIALCLFGGFTPSLATVLADKNKDATPAGFIITVLSAVSILGLLIAPPNRYTTNSSLDTSTTEKIDEPEQGVPNDLEVPEIS